MANILEVTDPAHPALDPFMRLTENQLRNRLEPEKGIFIAESPKVIRLALAAGYQPVSFLMEHRHITGQAADFLQAHPTVPVYTGAREVLAAVTGYPLTRGVLCAMRRPAPACAEAICQNARRVAVLEGVVDATNVGAIFRSAAALQMDAVLVTATCCDPLNRRAVRVSMGTVFQVPWTVIDTVEQVSALGFRTAAMALTQRSLPIDHPAVMAEDRLAIVLGAEGDGLSQNTIAHCDYMVRIPMANGVDSLNVAAAAAVAFWQLRVQPLSDGKERL